MKMIDNSDKMNILKRLSVENHITTTAAFAATHYYYY